MTNRLPVNPPRYRRRLKEHQKEILGQIRRDERLPDALAMAEVARLMLANPRASIRFLAACVSRSIRTIGNYISLLKALGYLVGNANYERKLVDGVLRSVRVTNTWVLSTVGKLTKIAQKVAERAKRFARLGVSSRHIDAAAVRVVGRSFKDVPDAWHEMLSKYADAPPLEMSDRLLRSSLVKRR